MRLRLLAITFGLLLAFVMSTGSHAQDDAPEVIFTSPEEGQTISAPAFAIQMCFAEPVNILDLDKGGDFSYRVTPPEDTPLGLRIVFQPDGYGVAVYANNADAETPEGEWTVEYRLTAPETLTPTEGTLTYTVDPDGEELPQATPPPCAAGEAPQTGDDPDETDDGRTTDEDEGDDDDSDDDTDLILYGLIGVAAISAVALAAGLFMAARRRSSS